MKPIDEATYKVAMEHCEIGEDGFVRISRRQIIELARKADVCKAELEAPPGPRIIFEDDTLRTIEYPDGSAVNVHKIPNDSKYGVVTVRERTYLANLETGMIIPADEPVAIFRAKDIYAREALETYARIVEGAGFAAEPMTRDSATALWMRFLDFGKEHPDRMRKPT